MSNKKNKSRVNPPAGMRSRGSIDREARRKRLFEEGKNERNLNNLWGESVGSGEWYDDDYAMPY